MKMTVSDNEIVLDIELNVPDNEFGIPDNDVDIPDYETVAFLITNVDIYNNYFIFIKYEQLGHFSSLM